MVLVTHNAGKFRDISQRLVAAVVIALSYLMVSRIRFRSFKDVRPTKKTVGAVLLVAGCWIAMRMNRVHDAVIFLSLIAAYIVLGLCEEVVFFRRRIAERRAQQIGGGAAAVEDIPPDDEVLAELGAFDSQDESGEHPKLQGRKAAGQTSDESTTVPPSVVEAPKRA
jgi:CDP-diacylglycerol--serine O-phosphatidyltransferase